MLREELGKTPLASQVCMELESSLPSLHPLSCQTEGCKALLWARVLPKSQCFLKHTKDGSHSFSCLRKSKQALLSELLFALLKQCQEDQVCGWVILENASSLPRVLLTSDSCHHRLKSLGQSRKAPFSSSGDHPVHFQNTLSPCLSPPLLNAQVPGGAPRRLLEVLPAGSCFSNWKTLWVNSLDFD